MLLNKQAAKQAVREKGKQMSKDFLDALDRKVYEMVTKACESTRAGRLTGQELL